MPSFAGLSQTSEVLETSEVYDGKLAVSDYTQKEGQERITFRILADTYRLLQRERGGY